MFVVIRKKTVTYIMIAILFIICSTLFYGIFHVSRKFKVTSENDSQYYILINIEEKLLYLYEDDVCVHEYPIASGKSESPSPIGHWQIIEKSDWGEGFGGCWLGLDVPWGTYGIHGTMDEDTIGSAASHGCIRMLNEDVRELYELVPEGTSVMVENGPYGPFGTGFRDLAPGDRGADVLAVQKRLKELEFYQGEENGIYEDDLKRAVYDFQEDRELSIKYTLTYEDYMAMGFAEFE